MKLFKKKVLTPRSKRKVFEVYNENTTNTGSPRKVKRTEDKENADAGLNTSRKLASMAVNLKDKVTRPFSAHEQNFAVTSIDMENDYEFNKKLYQVDNPTAADRTEGGADFDDLLGKEQLSPPRVQLDCSNVFSPAKRVLTTDRTRKLVHRTIFADRVEEQQDETGTGYTNFEELSSQIRLSFNDKRFSDVVIRCGMALEHKFYAHRIILANRSRYFESVFAASALELKSGRFCIDKPAMFAEIFSKVLEYMYTGCVHLHLDNVLEVLSMSEEFGIDSLKSLCEKYITQNIDVNNACLLLELSRQYRAQPLSNFVLRFIDSRENVKAVLASEACSALSRETLQCIIERDTLQLSNTEEVNIFHAVLSWIKKNGDSQIDDILGLIRFPIMTPQQLSDIVEPQGLVPQELLFEAYRHHLVPQKSNHFHRFMQRNRVPVPELSVSGPAEQEKASEEQDDDLADIRLDDSVEMRE